jgi:uncharacterized protein YecA (UPF0149 family)
MKEDFKNMFDLSIPRRHYYSKDYGLANCPECGLPLVENNCTVMLSAKSDTDEGEFMSNLTGSHFCNSCPVVVFDSEKIEEAAKHGMRGSSNLRYLIAGIVNFNAIPAEKRHLEIGIDENPVPLVRFLPDLNKTTVVSGKKTGRNEPCPCGSGKKYKKCCG